MESTDLKTKQFRYVLPQLQLTSFKLLALVLVYVSLVYRMHITHNSQWSSYYGNHTPSDYNVGQWYNPNYSANFRYL